jgi:membrane protein DedA with SNARE-associated domain
MPWRRFIVADVIAGTLWGTYAALLGYIGGKQFEEQPWKGALIGLAIAFTAAFLVEFVRNRRAKRSGRPEAAAPDSDA